MSGIFGSDDFSARSRRKEIEICMHRNAVTAEYNFDPVHAV
ncbi:MAG TPA: hypothetical protein VKQ11_05730 [Candidatus Sulfotelmatobacter sp.]|nr:hypothetical protein [Candidatus Sulfotelmatobacter sp.]